MTPSTIGWVLVDGDDGDGATLARDELTVRGRHSGAGAVDTAELATAAVLRLQTIVEAEGQRLRGIGVTWSDDAAVEAALVMESLAGEGFDNVVPVRLRQAAQSSTGPVPAGTGAQVALARGAALVLGPEAEFTDARFDEVPAAHPGDDRVRSRGFSYAGALTMLVAGALTFVVSLSIAVTPTHDRLPVEQVARAPVPVQVAETPAQAPGTGAMFISLREGAPVHDAPEAARQAQPGRSLLQRMLAHIPGLRGR